MNDLCIFVLLGLQVGAPPEMVYAGLWGFNGYLTGACLGGSFLVLNGQSAAATTVAVVFTGFMQHFLQLLLKPVSLFHFLHRGSKMYLFELKGFLCICH